MTRSLIYHLACKETGIAFPYLAPTNLAAGAHFLTIHNVYYQLSLMGGAREAIKEDQYPKFVKEFFHTLYHGDMLQYPRWAIDALKTVGIDLLE